MVKIAPSILSADFANLERDIGRIRSADYVHVDVMDGCFVPNISIGVPVVKSIRRVTDLPLDVHLMIDRPSRYIDAFASAGADILTIHVEADIPEEITRTLAMIKDAGVRTGISIKPKTKAEVLLPWIEIIDLVLVMTVEPGFGGQAFMADQLPKINQVKKLINEKNPFCELEVDGGIDLDTCGLVTQAGANVLVAGSAVFGKPDVEQRVEMLRKRAEASE